MSRYWSGTATEKDAEDLVADVRREDRDEWIAAGSGTTLGALKASLLGYARVARLGGPLGPVLCIWGAVPTDAPQLATAWLIGTRTGQLHARRLHRILSREFDAMTTRWPCLQCWADDRNHTHHRWIAWLGFKPLRRGPFGPFGLSFTYYLREPPHVPSSHSGSDDGGRGRLGGGRAPGQAG